MFELYNQDCKELLESDAIKDRVDRIIIVTDPPFNIGYHYNTYKDNMVETEYYMFLKDIFTQYDIPFVCIHYPESIVKLSCYCNVFPEKIVSWVYNSNTARQHRDIAFYKVRPDFNAVKQAYKNPNDKRIKQRIADGKGARLYDWWNINQVKNVSKDHGGLKHPCIMPIEVMKNIIGILPKGYIIFDPFMGSGTTGMACKELGRDFIGCEIDTEYFEEAKKRLLSEEHQSIANQLSK